MFKKLFFTFLLFSSTLSAPENILKFFNKEYTQTEGENDCLCDIDNEHCNYLCCCDTKCGGETTEYWRNRSKCIDEKDSIGIFADRCIDHNLVFEFKGHKNKKYRRRGLERIEATEDISDSIEVIDNYCYSIDNSNKMKKEITSMSIDTDDSSSTSTSSRRRLDKDNINKNNRNNKKYISINENESPSNFNSQLRANSEKNINITNSTNSNTYDVFGKDNKFSLYSGSDCSNNNYVERMVSANYSCSMEKTNIETITKAIKNSFIYLEKTNCTLDKLYKIDNDGLLNFENENNNDVATNEYIVEVEFIIQMNNYDSINHCSINAVKMNNDNLGDKINFKNTVIFTNRLNMLSVPYRYSGTNGYLNGLPLKVYNGTRVFNEFYIVGRYNDGNCRTDDYLYNYLYFSDKPILFNQNYSYSCNLNGNSLSSTTLFKKLDKIDKIAKYGNSHYNKIDDESLWLRINKNGFDRNNAENTIIKMNIYLGTRKIGIHSFKYIYKVILKNIKNKRNTDKLFLDINYYDLDKKQDFQEKPTTPQFIPSMPADLLDPLIYSKVDK